MHRRGFYFYLYTMYTVYVVKKIKTVSPQIQKLQLLLSRREDDFGCTHNLLATMYMIKKRIKNAGFLTKIIISFCSASTIKRIDPLELFVDMNVILFSIYPYLSFTLLLYFHFDPGYLFAKYVLHLETHTLLGNLLTLPIRIIQFLPVIQYFRLLAFLLCSLTLSALLVLDGVRKLDLWAILIRISKHSASKQVLKYFELVIILQLLNDILSRGAAILMGVALLLCVLFNYVSIKLYSFIPMPLYLCFPSVAALILLLINCLLPLGINVNEKTVKLKEKWERHLARCRDRGYQRRILIAIKPLCVICGVAGFNVLKLVKGIRVWFYSQIFNYTISALLSKCKACDKFI